MRIGGVDFPRELVNAHRSGRLALFVGAGASMDSPSDLPDFRQLTKTIAHDAHYPVTDSELDRPDEVLGRIEDRGVDVHLRVSELLRTPSSRRNALHEAIADLGLSSPCLRVVTTNFDRHLTSAIEARSVEFDEYAAPALPVGSDFDGMVYLHGTLGQRPARLVITEDDFGRAYLRDAWAARFLERMFAEFTVLFIGYSHGDVVMRYLARALGTDSRRYVLTDKPDHRDWRDLRLEPIGYEVADGSHAALGAALARWAEHADMGMLDHRRRVADLVSFAPTGIPEDDSYLEELITDPERVPLFTEFARAPEWLDWASTQPPFLQLFTRGSPEAPPAWALASWFVEHYAMHEAHTARALGVVSDAGGYLGPEICEAIGFHLHRRDQPRPEWLGPWIVLLLRHAHTVQSDWLEFALRASTWPNDRAQALLLFDHLTEPTAGLSRSLGSDTPSIGVHLRADEYWLNEAWLKVIKPNLPEIAEPILAMADRHLRRACDLQVATQPAQSSWDAISFRRHAIEPHPQNDYRDSVDVLIDAARDALELLLDAGSPTALGYLDSWADSSSQVLRRLAIHGWTHRPDADPSAKLDWVTRSGWLFDHTVHHEIFRLIEAALPGASDGAVDSLIEIITTVDEDEPDHRPYARFNVLVWMDQARPGHPAVTNARAEAHAVDPNWQPRSHPDLTHSMSVGFVPARPPMSEEEFHGRVQADVAAALAGLDRYRNASHWDGGPTWDDARSLVRSTVQANPGDGYLLLDHDTTGDFTPAVLDGWSRAVLDPAAATAVIDRIRALDLAPHTRELARLLSTGGQTEGHPTDWTAVPAARLLARELWDHVPDDETVAGDIDWLHRAINHPAGNLTEFWLRAIQHDWRSDESAWSGLTVEHRSAVEASIGGPSEQLRTTMAEVVCASRLHFLFAADSDWTVEHVLPLLDWTDNPRSRRAWDSFINWGRWDDELLDAGLMEHYLETVNQLHEFDDRQREAILGHLAGIALTSDRQPHTWLPGAIIAMNQGDRTTFADRLADILDDLPIEAVEHQWTRWIHKHWVDRLASVPTQLSLDEASAMAGWIPFLTTSFEQGAQLVTSHAGRFREHDDVLRHLERHLGTDPDPCARVIGHLMRGTSQPWWDGYELKDLVPRLRPGSDPAHLGVIIEQAVRLGYNDAESW